MDNKKPILFWGTPLSKQSEASPSTAGYDCGPINSRRARLNQQQTVRDEEGRRRFHGAFTGGFSAGYYNTVDSVQGFRPKSFVSHRKNRDAESKFSHNPEDYMDEEDFGEFGIAQRKIRPTKAYQTGQDSRFAKSSNQQKLISFLRSDVESIGERILRRMTNNGRYQDGIPSGSGQPNPKNDYHGLGYKPLKISFKPKDPEGPSNSLKAVLKGGTRLGISGEAFGIGVLDDQEDDEMNSSQIDQYGYDNMSNYEFSDNKIPGRKTNVHSTNTTGDKFMDRYALDGFVLARDLNSMTICDDLSDIYPRPIIDPGWRVPERSEPYVPPQSSLNEQQQELLWKKTHEKTSSFSNKFIKSANKKDDNDICPSGLVAYSDLKTEYKTKPGRLLPSDYGGTSNYNSGEPNEAQTIQSTVHRQIIEWRPCSLLCKHFNVPNPFPDNSFFGVKPKDVVPQTVTEKPPEIEIQLAPIELRRSIFNVDFGRDVVCTDGESDHDEEEPQVIDTKSETSDHEIEVIKIPKPEPELIVLTSSDDTDDDKDEEYGPPLPPTQKKLMDLDQKSCKRHKT